MPTSVKQGNDTTLNYKIGNRSTRQWSEMRKETECWEPNHALFNPEQDMDFSQRRRHNPERLWFEYQGLGLEKPQQKWNVYIEVEGVEELKKTPGWHAIFTAFRLFSEPRRLLELKQSEEKWGASISYHSSALNEILPVTHLQVLCVMATTSCKEGRENK